jgi:hypothetical protein
MKNLGNPLRRVPLGTFDDGHNAQGDADGKEAIDDVGDNGVHAVATDRGFING